MLAATPWLLLAGVSAWADNTADIPVTGSVPVYLNVDSSTPGGLNTQLPLNYDPTSNTFDGSRDLVFNTTDTSKGVQVQLTNDDHMSGAIVGNTAQVPLQLTLTANGVTSTVLQNRNDTTTISRANMNWNNTTLTSPDITLHVLGVPTGRIPADVYSSHVQLTFSLAP
ncbi:hypothetical protein THUN1379_02240 [Paludibacterium sp. THUN1379]|nr:hypothetical protein THUN1379_02240 [Paludibacterium sp. THUN1379]